MHCLLARGEAQGEGETPFSASFLAQNNLASFFLSCVSLVWVVPVVGLAVVAVQRGKEKKGPLTTPPCVLRSKKENAPMHCGCVNNIGGVRKGGGVILQPERKEGETKLWLQCERATPSRSRLCHWNACSNYGFSRFGALGRPALSKTRKSAPALCTDCLATITRFW